MIFNMSVKTIHFRLPVFLMNGSLKVAGFTIVFLGLRHPNVGFSSADVTWLQKLPTNILTSTPMGMTIFHCF